MKADNIDIIIADDHKLFRKSIVSLLEHIPVIDKIREAKNGEVLMKFIKEREPNVVLLDLDMPIIDGFKATKLIIKKYPNIKILILTMYDNLGFVNYLWEQGIHGYLVKNTNLEEMKNSIISVVEKDFYNNKILMQMQMERKSGNKKDFYDETHIILTTREKSVLRSICKEQTSKEIAIQLKLSYRTIDKIRQKLKDKIGVSNVVGLVKYALKNKIIKF